MAGASAAVIGAPPKYRLMARTASAMSAQSRYALPPLGRRHRGLKTALVKHAGLSPARQKAYETLGTTTSRASCFRIAAHTVQIG
jgi:hypothetical protein